MSELEESWQLLLHPQLFGCAREDAQVWGGMQDAQVWGGLQDAQAWGGMQDAQAWGGTQPCHRLAPSQSRFPPAFAAFAGGLLEMEVR